MFNYYSRYYGIVWNVRSIPWSTKLANGAVESVAISAALSLQERTRWLMSSRGVISTAKATRNSHESRWTVSVVHAALAVAARYCSNASVVASAGAVVSTICCRL